MEKFSGWTDPGTGINPFLIPPAPRRSAAVRVSSGCLAFVLIVVRLPLAAAAFLLLALVSWTLMVVSCPRCVPSCPMRVSCAMPVNAPQCAR